MNERLEHGTLSAVTIAIVCALSLPTPVHAVDERLSIGLETGPLRFSRNDVRIPGDEGTRFDLTRTIGSDAVPFVRLDGLWRLDDRHSLRLVLAPLSVSETGELARDTNFAGETFRAGRAEGTYRFNAYKLTYRYTFAERGDWIWGVGFTGIVRDAKVEL